MTSFMSKTLGDLKISLSGFDDELLKSVPTFAPDSPKDETEENQLDASTADLLYFQNIQGLINKNQEFTKEDSKKEGEIKEIERNDNTLLMNHMIGSNLSSVEEEKSIYSGEDFSPKTLATIELTEEDTKNLNESKDFHEFVTSLSRGKKGVSGGDGAKNEKRVQSRVLEVQIRVDVSSEDLKFLFIQASRSEGFVVTSKERNRVSAERRQYDSKGNITGSSHLANLILGLSKGRSRIMLIQLLVGLYDDVFADLFIRKLKEGLYKNKFLKSSFNEEELSSSNKQVSLDPQYVGDLEESFFRELKIDVQAFISPLDKCAKDAELRCAVYITALQPCLEANTIPITTPLRAPSVSDFPLTIPAIERIEDVFPPSSSFSEKLEICDKNTKKYIIQRCNNELQARTNQKKMQVLKRVEACELHKCQLLEEIFNHPKIFLSPLNKAFLNACPEMIEEIVLLDIACMMGKWPGRMWVTFNLIAFYSNVVAFKKKKCIHFKDILCIKQEAAVLGIGDSLSIESKDKSKDFFIFAFGIDRLIEISNQLLLLTKQNYSFLKKDAISMTATIVLNNMISPSTSSIPKKNLEKKIVEFSEILPSENAPLSKKNPPNPIPIILPTSTFQIPIVERLDSNSSNNSFHSLEDEGES